MSDKLIPSPDPSNSLRTPGQGLDKEQAFLRIMQGHWRYLENEKERREVTPRDRDLHAQGQFPFAAILGCADSRVSPELIFDQGQGDIFVVRVAGSIVGNGELASMEYAVTNLGVRLLMVLGHEQCGAVCAALESAPTSETIGFLIREIGPAIEEARAGPGPMLENAIIANVRRSAELLASRSEAIAAAVRDGKLRIIGAVYSLSSGDLEVHHVIG